MKEGRTSTPPLQAAEQESLSDAEIEAILASEAGPPPLESHLPAQPIPLVAREPGQGRFGRWVVWLIIAFVLLSVWQAIR